VISYDVRLKYFVIVVICLSLKDVVYADELKEASDGFQMPVTFDLKPFYEPG